MTSDDGDGFHASPEESLLIRRAQNGDLAAASHLLQQHRAMISRYLSKRVRTPEDAEDLEQETLVRASKALVNYRGEGAFSGWLLGIAANLLKNYYERVLPRQGRFASLDALEESNPALVKQSESTACPYRVVDRTDYVANLLRVLPLACTEVESHVILLVYQERDYAEISLLLGIEQDAVRQHFLRGREKLLAYLVEQEPELIGGKDLILTAWKAACNAEDIHLKPTREEEGAWLRPQGRAKTFRKAVLKLARFLPLSGLVSGFLIGLV